MKDKQEEEETDREHQQIRKKAEVAQEKAREAQKYAAEMQKKQEEEEKIKQEEIDKKAEAKKRSDEARLKALEEARQEEELKRKKEEARRKADLAQSKKLENEEKVKREEERVKALKEEEAKQKQETEKQRRKSRIEVSTDDKEEMKDDIVMESVRRKISNMAVPAQPQQAQPVRPQLPMQDNLPYLKTRQDEDITSAVSVDKVDHGDTSAVIKPTEGTASKKTSFSGAKRPVDLPAVDDASLAETLRKNQLLQEERQKEAERSTLEGQRIKKANEEHQLLKDAKQLAKQKEEDRLLAWEKRIIEERKARQEAEDQRERVRKQADTMRKKQEEEEEKARFEREAARERAREELRKCKESPYIPTATQDDKENIPKVRSRDKTLNDDIPTVDEAKRKAVYESVKNSTETDSAHKKEAESKIKSSQKASEEAEAVKHRIETNLTKESKATVSSRPYSMYEPASPVYYSLDSAVRRNSKDSPISYTRRNRDDDLADEIEAIRLAADLSSRRMLAEQRPGSSATTSSSASSRARIRALLDKQKTQREEEDKSRSDRRDETNKFLWLYR